MTTETQINGKRKAGLNLSLRVVFPILLGLILLTSVYAHIRVAGAENYVGSLGLLDRVFDLALAATIALLVISLGSALTKLFKLSFVGAAERLCFSFFIGTGVFGSAILLLGLVGFLRPVPVSLVAVLILVISRQELPKLFGILLDSLRRLLATPIGKVFVALFSAFALLLILRTATPPHVFDENIYHLPVTSEFVRQRRVFPSFDNSMGNQPFLIHMIYAVCLLAGSDIAAKFFSLIIALGTALSLYAFSQRFLSARVGRFAAFAFFAAGMVTEVAVTTRVDVSVAGMLFLATYAMMNYLRTSERQWLWVSSLLAGFSLGIKHSAVFWIFLLGVMYLIESLVKRQHDLRTILSRGVGYSLIALAIASPWYVKNYVWFGNPFYPFFTGEVAAFGSQGVRYFDAEDEHRLDDYFNVTRREIPELVQAEEQALLANAQNRPARHPMRPWEIYLKPADYLMAEGRHLPNYLFLIIPLSLIIKRNRWVFWLLGLASCYFLMVTWSSWIARYLLPAYPALTIVTAYTIVTAGDWLKNRISSTRIIPSYLVAAALIVVMGNCVLSLRETHALEYITGKLSRSDFMLAFTYYPPIVFINRELPPNARVMSFGAQMTYGMQREFESDETWYATKWRRLLVGNSSLQGVNEDLKRQGINYILYSPNLFLFAARMGLDNGQAVPPKPGQLIARLMGRQTPAVNDSPRNIEEAKRLGADYPLLRNWATFTLYRNKFLETVYSDDEGYRVYRIR